MKYTVEESLYEFRAWAGGKNTLNDLLKCGAVDKAEEYIEERIAYREEPPTQTEINNILWFERDEIYKYCGIYNAVYGITDEDDEAWYYYEDDEEEE